MNFPIIEFPPSPGLSRGENGAEQRTLCAFPARIEPESTYIEARLRLQGLAHKMRWTVMSDISPSGQLPVLLDRNAAWAGRGILDLLRTRPSDGFYAVLDNPSDTNWADATALAQLIRRLGAAVAFHFFLLPANFAAVVQPLYRKELAAPLAFILAKSDRNKAMELVLEAQSGAGVGVDAVLGDTKAILVALSNRLTSGPFFFGERCAPILHHCELQSD